VRLTPKDDKYFTLLSEMATHVSRGGSLFAKVFQDYASHVAYAEQIKQIEVECDDLGATITRRLNSSFITPIDREDIYLLVTELDDVIDMLNDLARRLDIYDVSEPRPDAAEIAALLSRATAEIADAFSLLEQHKELGEHCNNIRQIEKRADAMYNAAVRRLFKEEKNPIEVIKWMSLYEELENSIDRCKDVAEALEAVLVKNK
jgi:predicted phosphate transport protein (TIGR00153 family)